MRHPRPGSTAVRPAPRYRELIKQWWQLIWNTKKWQTGLPKIILDQVMRFSHCTSNHAAAPVHLRFGSLLCRRLLASETV